MEQRYFLLKELAPREDSSLYSIASFDGSSKTFKVHFFYETEDQARAAHSKMMFGFEDDA